MGNSAEIKYAGFFTRLLATLVDIFLLGLLMKPVSAVFGQTSILLFLLIWWLYSSIMIVKWRATLGGKLLGIEVVDVDLEPLSFLKASLRFAISIAPFLLYILVKMIYYGIVSFPSPTVWQLPQLIYMIPPLIMFFTRQRQMLHDLFAKSITLDVSELKHQLGIDRGNVS